MKHAIHDGTVRVGPVLAITSVLESLGYEAAAVLTDAGFDPHLLDDPDTLLTFSGRAGLMGTFSEVTGCAHFGLLVGAQGNLSSFGLVGYLAMHSSDVAAALQSLIRYLHFHVQGSAGVLDRSDNSAFFGYEILQPLSKGADQLEDGALASMYNIMRQLCGSDWRQTEVWFTHRMPRDTGPYRQFFRAPLRFDMEKSGLFFSARWLNCSVQAADPELHRLLQKTIDGMEARFKDDFPQQVRRVVRQALISRHATADEVAALFSIHSRTLHRRLREQGITFQDLVDECRYAIARHMLQNSDTSLIQIADIVGYADARAFSRAFKRWTGTTPAKWRSTKDLSSVTDPKDPKDPTDYT